MRMISFSFVHGLLPVSWPRYCISLWCIQGAAPVKLFIVEGLLHFGSWATSSLCGYSRIVLLLARKLLLLPDTMIFILWLFRVHRALLEDRGGSNVIFMEVEMFQLDLIVQARRISRVRENIVNFCRAGRYSRRTPWMYVSCAFFPPMRSSVSEVVVFAPLLGACELLHRHY